MLAVCPVSSRRCELTFKNTYDPESMLPRYVEARAPNPNPNPNANPDPNPNPIQARAKEGVPREAQVR